APVVCLGPVAVETLSPRALNRATLARQLLLGRSEMPVLDAVEHLVGLQAQVPHNPYTALWSRLDRFRPAELAGLIEGRRAVRTVVMRATIHLVSADDCLALRPLMQPVLDAELSRHPEFSPELRGVDLRPVLALAHELLGERPLTQAEIRAAMQERFPGLHSGALAYACRCLLPLVQVPPRGLWGRSGQVRSATAESWLGRPLAADPSIDAAVLRYLGAFGPATAADVATWSRLTGLRPVLERLRSRLRTFRDERGRELFDLPDAPRPDPAMPAPPRFLPEYDNALLSHADRSRVVPDEARARLSAAGGVGVGSVLVDGLLAAVWRLERDRGSGGSTLVVRHLPMSKRAAASVAAEGRRLLRLMAAGAPQADVRLEAAP
ncbi:MAG TPA: winged helix DNA-binding domain-containing protein, partial [Miltoncostaeaceae bacterium]|nr:winged helix DNA-binding domain-containing protein [Miltoncostaeaceae bacterium]